MRTGSFIVAALAGVVSAWVGARDARACGGCFHPPEGDHVSVITDHRMILSISPQQTTLYDQIRYQGDPGSFAWVLPTSGPVEVGLSADAMFGTLDTLTETTVTAPPTNCPPPPNCGARGGADEFAAVDGGAPYPGVDVTRHEVVGPYETVQLHSTDPNALNAWLSANGYAIPDDVKPIIAAYVNEHFDFLAMKLAPGQGVNAMRPVRVSSAGASPILPLRMVAAGTGATVGITLWVLGDGRYETQNFPSFRVDDAEIAWDWAQSRSNYTELRAAKQADLGGHGWEIESSLSLFQRNVDAILQSPSVAQDYAPVEENGQVVKSADTVRQEDQYALFAGIGLSDGSVRITRLRSDLAHAALGQDLVLTASQDQAVLSNVRQATKEIGEPLCPVYIGCNQVGTAPRSQVLNREDDDGGLFSCRASAQPLLDNGALGSIAAGVVAVFVSARRRRRRD